MTEKPLRSTASLWARFRFAVVGALLSAPPPRGELKAALRTIAEKTWTHPVSGHDVRFATATIERWYYRARKERDDPVNALRRAVRKDRGKISLAAAVTEHLAKQYVQHPCWSYQLHYDNLVTLQTTDPSLGPLRSYSTVRRYMKAHGMLRKRRPERKLSPGEARAAYRRETREIRSYEVEYVGGLWHLDFHHGSHKVLTSEGTWKRPVVLGILDDHARLCCHIQWYLSETTEDLVHGFSQAIQKFGLPRALLTDNGSAMLAEEFRDGLLALGIYHERTMSHSPYQNGKQESFWSHLEGRLMEMLEGVPELTLDFLNQATQAWVEMEYNRRVHREITCSPLERFAQAPDVLRPSPSSDALREAFRLQTTRRQRRGDGTISLDGVRFEIPARYRDFIDIVLRYARWDLSRVDMLDPHGETILARIYPLDRKANADGRRALIEPDKSELTESDGQARNNDLPPLLKKILQDYSATGIPPAYLPKKPHPKQGEES